MKKYFLLIIFFFKFQTNTYAQYVDCDVKIINKIINSNNKTSLEDKDLELRRLIIDLSSNKNFKSCENLIIGSYIKFMLNEQKYIFNKSNNIKLRELFNLFMFLLDVSNPNYKISTEKTNWIEEYINEIKLFVLALSRQNNSYTNVSPSFLLMNNQNKETSLNDLLKNERKIIGVLRGNEISLALDTEFINTGEMYILLFHELYHKIDQFSSNIKNILVLIEKILKNDFDFKNIDKLFSDKKQYDKILELSKDDLFQEIDWSSIYTILLKDAPNFNRFSDKFKSIESQKVFLFMNWLYLNAQMMFISEFRAIKASILMFEHIRAFNNWEIPSYLYTSDQIKDKKFLNTEISKKIKEYYFEQNQNYYHKILELIGYDKLFQEIDHIIDNSEDESNENFYNINYMIGNKS